jgi:hypothetical protein
MATKSFVRTRPGQRVDQPDFERASDTSTRDVVEQIGEHFLTGLDTGRHYVLEGLITTNPTGTTLQVTGGKAIVGYRDRGEIRYGSLLTSGATSRSIDVSAFTDGAYTVYVCLSLSDNEYGNRAFWDATLGTPAEVTRNVPTRRVENWSIAVETTSPGAEWIPVATFTKSGASLTGLTDVRELYFEGQAANSYAVLDPEWGTSNDRNANRSTYGIRSLRKFVRAVQRQISSIIGGTGWWSAIPAGSDLTSLLANKLARNGSQTMTGNLLPDADNTRNIGSSTFRWQHVYSADGSFGQIAALPRFLSSVTNSAVNGGGRAKMLEGVTSGTSPNLEYRAIYQNENSSLTSSPSLEIAVNAEWYYDLGLAGNRWRSYNTSAESFLYSFSRSGLRIHRRSPTASVWQDASWSQLYSFDETIADLTQVPTTSVGVLTAERATLSINAPTTPVANTTYANTLVVARGTISTDGAGGITVGPSPINTGVNVTAVLLVGNVRVTFNTALNVSGAYQIICTPWTAGTALDIQGKTSNYFDISATTTSTGLDLPMNTNPMTFDFIVVGG